MDLYVLPKLASIATIYASSEFECLGACETTFYPSTPGSMKWLYLKVHTLLMKEKNASVFLDVKLHLWLKPDSLLPMHDLQFRIDKYIFQAWTL